MHNLSSILRLRDILTNFVNLRSLKFPLFNPYPHQNNMTLEDTVNEPLSVGRVYSTAQGKGL